MVVGNRLKPKRPQGRLMLTASLRRFNTHTQMKNTHWTDSVYQEVTDKLIAQLEAGTVPWRKPWATGGFAPMNLVSRKAYRGINSVILGFSDFASPVLGNL